MSSYQGEAFDRIAVQDALDIIGGYARVRAGGGVLMATETELRDPLAAVREAIDIPFAATVGEGEKRAATLKERAMVASVILRRVLDEPEGMDYLRADTKFLRNQLADRPVDYVAREEADR